MNFGTLLKLNEEDLNDTIFKSAAAGLINNDKIVANKIESDISKHHHSVMKKLIENKIKEELYNNKRSDILHNLDWLTENVSNQINTDYLANILIGSDSLTSKINIDLTRNFVFNSTDFSQIKD